MSAASCFTDFRVQPVDAPMTAYVYDPHTWQPTYVLDNDNLFTRTEYDPAGRVRRVYREVLDQPGRPGGQRLVAEKEYNYRMMRAANWLRTGISQTQGNVLVWQVRDINPLSPTFGTTDFQP